IRVACPVAYSQLLSRHFTEALGASCMLEADTVVQGRYRIIRQIGKGGMGTVYVARDENLGVTVAVKRNVFNDDRLIKAFKREARLLAGLRHPSLPQVKDYFINDVGQFLVMEYIGGDDFGTIIE